MTVGIVGLGLIGGSFAKAYHAAGWTVYGYDVDESMLAFAQLADAVNAPLTMENIGTCDLVLLCVPAACRDRLSAFCRAAYRKQARRDRLLRHEARGLRRRRSRWRSSTGFTYLGGHPMAGTQYSGFGHAACESVSQCADGHCAAGF